jgi:rod shape-determining protein MreD
VIRRLRLVLLLALAILLQTSLFPHLRIGGAVPDVALVLTVAVATREGPDVGAMFGFAAGFLIDLYLQTPLGLSALAFALTGGFVGVLQAGLLRPGRWLPPLLGALGALAGNLIFIGVGILAGQDQLRSAHTFHVLGFAVLYDALIAAFVFPLALWATRPSPTTRTRVTGAGWGA